MNPRYEPCEKCGEPNYLYDLYPWCANCVIEREKAKRRAA